VSTSSLMDSD